MDLEPVAQAWVDEQVELVIHQQAAELRAIYGRFAWRWRISRIASMRIGKCDFCGRWRRGQRQEWKMGLSNESEWLLRCSACENA